MVKQERLSSTAKETQKFAATPMLFCQIAQPESDYLLIPIHSSGSRKYIPLGFMEKDVIASNATLIIPNATLYMFGILMSSVHMAWTRTVCGRIKSDYRYSKDIVYNNFCWADVTDEQKKAIEKTAQGILDARALYPDSSLADLYDERTMPPELRKAHNANDKAVLKAYGLKPDTPEEEIVKFLMKRYQELTICK